MQPRKKAGQKGARRSLLPPYQHGRKRPCSKKAQLSHLPWRNWLVRSTVSYEFAVEEEGTRGVVMDKKVQKEALPDRLELSTSR
jgi:hypothetical protein